VYIVFASGSVDLLIVVSFVPLARQSDVRNYDSIARGPRTSAEVGIGAVFISRRKHSLICRSTGDFCGRIKRPRRVLEQQQVQNLGLVSFTPSRELPQRLSPLRIQSDLRDTRIVLPCHCKTNTKSLLFTTYGALF